MPNQPTTAERLEFLTETFVAANAAAWRNLEEVIRSGTNSPGFWTRYEAAAIDVNATLRIALPYIEAPGVVVHTVDGPMVVAAVDRPTADDVRWTLTVDGGPALIDWHAGLESDESPVRYERWTMAGRLSHGYVDPASRRIVQTG